MSWTFTLEGQPPSWNHSYTIVTKYRIGTYGGRIPYSSLAKKQKVKDYQEAAIWIIKAAMPHDWKPKGLVRTKFRFYLARDIDCDNILKAVHDALATAIRVDDKMFLPCVIKKETGWPKKHAKVEVIVEDLGSP